MKKYYVTIGLFFSTIVCISLLSMAPLDIMKSSGGPAFNTNAPGEKTCSGPESPNNCHSGGIADNTGLATKSITFSGGTSYTPGQTYTVTVTISHPTSNRFGFQIVSLRNSDNANTGTVVITDAARTQNEVPGYGTYPTRSYVMHVVNGTNGLANSCTWSYNWTAPSTDEGAITFYACMMAANNNNTNDAGDETYFTQLTINPVPAGISTHKSSAEDIVMYPNPAQHEIFINYNLTEVSLFKAELLDVQGKLVQVLFQDEKAVGAISEKITLNQNISPGIYLIKFTTDKMQSTKRILLN